MNYITKNKLNVTLLNSKERVIQFKHTYSDDICIITENDFYSLYTILHSNIYQAKEFYIALKVEQVDIDNNNLKSISFVNHFGATQTMNKEIFLSLYKEL